MIYSCILRYILVNSGKFRYLQESIPVHQRIYISTALSLTIWTGRKLGGLRQQIQIYDLGIKSDCLTIRPLWYCVLESRWRESDLRLGFVLPVGKCSLSRNTRNTNLDFEHQILTSSKLHKLRRRDEYLNMLNHLDPTISQSSLIFFKPLWTFIWEHHE